MNKCQIARNMLFALTVFSIGSASAVELDSLVITETLESAMPQNIPGENESSELTERAGIQNILQYALSHEGKPYRRGSSSPEIGFDCSGFVRHVFEQIGGLSLPHNAQAISKIGTLVSKAELIPGDIVFFHRAKKAITHVGIYMGDNQFIHASSRQTGRVMVSNLSDRYWVKHYSLARRLELRDIR
ncbi:MAG: C40 family peptidase [Gallionellaceae bacterium]|jgi:cell wall-associated NlpC family hydrolase